MAKVLYDKCNSAGTVIGGIEDHVHILLRLSRTWTIASVVEAVKTSTSKWIKTKGPEFREFAWQAGYGAFSVSRSKVEGVAGYIRDQKEHHKKSTIENEFRGLLTKHGVEYDEEYVWD